MRALLIVLLVACAAACSEPSTSADAGRDGGAAIDSGSSTADAGGDAGSASDAGAPGDAGSTADAGSDAGGASSDAGSDASAGACDFTGDLERGCTNDARCVVAVHQTDCCGNTVAIGINHSARDLFDAAEAVCRATYPACGCPTGPTATDSGETAFDPRSRSGASGPGRRARA